MSPRGRHKSEGPSQNISPREVARRDHEDDRARERMREIPTWATSQLDHALASGLVRDDDLPTSTDDLVDLVLRFGWTLGPLAQLCGSGLLHEREVALMSWRGKASVAKLALESGADLRDKIAELREPVAA